MPSYLLVVLFFGLVFAGICGLIAENRGHTRGLWIVLGFVFGVFALVGILLLPKGEHGNKTCPDCAETIKAEARICRHCGHEFPDAQSIQAQRVVEAPHPSGLPRSDSLRCPSCGCGPPNVELVEGKMIFCNPEEKVTGVLAAST
ncbi:MAG: zinc ribbon domain-containing protein [Solirubrobacterales bacterium]